MVGECESMAYFWVYEDKLSADVGFGMFHIGHLCWLAGLTVLILVLMWWYVRLPDLKQRRMECVTGFSMVFLIALRFLYVIWIGAKLLYELPLHLCSMMGILCAVFCVTRWEWLGQVLYGIGLPGAVLALIFPDWNSYPAIHFITIEGFLFHAGIVLFVLMQLYSHRIVPQVKGIWQVMLFLVVVGIPVCLFDRAFDVNYMFVHWPPADSPLALLAGLGAWGYLAGYAALLFFCVVVMVWGYALVRRRKV